jgi:hypothetical protein
MVRRCHTAQVSSCQPRAAPQERLRHAWTRRPQVGAQQRFIC